MARMKTNNEDEEVVETAAATEETKGGVAEATVTTGKKKVKIRIVEEVDCLIGCIPYKFSKDKEAIVPADVAAILCYAKKAYRL